LEEGFKFVQEESQRSLNRNLTAGTGCSLTCNGTENSIMKPKGKIYSFLGIIQVSFLLFLSGCAASGKNSGINNAGSSPNMIFILADDLGYGDLGSYGQQKILTPHLDRMAAGGIRFTSFYAGSTVCAPSRASLMTGRHTGHVSVRGNGEFPLAAGDGVLPQVLKQRGYVNGMVGKWGLGLKGTTGEPEKKGWDFFAGHLHHVEGHYQKPDSAWQLINGASTKVRIPDGIYANEWFNNSALQFIKENRTKPFFLYVAYTLLHAELVVPDQYLQPYLVPGLSSFRGSLHIHQALN
jgi:arylsulfatase A-like enzyme